MYTTELDYNASVPRGFLNPEADLLVRIVSFYYVHTILAACEFFSNYAHSECKIVYLLLTAIEVESKFNYAIGVPVF